eukprot:CAMPEP_0119123172 /NCGR_PEP_ID=MMETSP1310-20130426/3200_1 /TAXON_ID=464262 /ORGANISM="Genus nov. species nov., Strain RCC2339" /LENGTH=289 /DNA_ID=CAMNT_0007112935 /DNA_START=211 /DNA_END=1080 /DNA_ORIENTATION=-
MASGGDAQVHVKVPSFERVEAKKPYVIYCVEVQFRAMVWRLHFRYSAMHSFHQALAKRYSSYVRLPHFPGKKLKGSNDPSLCEKRRMALGIYFKELLLLPVIQQSTEFHDLLGQSEKSSIAKDFETFWQERVMPALPHGDGDEYDDDHFLDRKSEHVREDLLRFAMNGDAEKFLGLLEKQAQLPQDFEPRCAHRLFEKCEASEDTKMVSILGYLKRMHYNFNLFDETGNSLLHITARKNCPKTVEFLLTVVDHPLTHNREKETALDIATRAGHREVEQQLVAVLNAANA